MSARRITFLAFSTAIGMILAYLEAVLIPSVGIPGVKIGLANLVTVFLVYRAKLIEALLSGVLRVALISLIFGNWVGFLFGILGLISSVALMGVLKRTGAFSVSAVSVSGALVHNLVQILIAAFLVGVKEIVYYLPILMLSGIGFGLLIGIVSAILIKKVPRFEGSAASSS